MSDDSSWSVVVPIKDLDQAKSRLDLTDPIRRGLALAIAIDSLRAVAGAAAEVVVVTSEETFAAIIVDAPDLLAQLVHVPDPESGLNVGFEVGLAATTHDARAALVGDLPALTSVELAQALSQVEPASVRHVPDHSGVGTTLLAGNGQVPVPRYGVASAAAHAANGSVPIEGAGAGLRLDIDSIDDLIAAAKIGVGLETARWLAVVLAGARNPLPAHQQATLRTSGSGATAFLDDGTVIDVATDSRWRPGQRITLRATGPELAGNDPGPTP